MKSTVYFEQVVLVRRPYLSREWCARAIAFPERVEVQRDGRVRYWLYIPELGKYLRVVTLPDGRTVHNAFPDRGFRFR